MTTTVTYSKDPITGEKTAILRTWTQEEIDEHARGVAAQALEVPSSVTAAQAITQIHRDGLRGALNVVLNAAGNEELKIAHDYSQSFNRNSAAVIALGAALNLTTAQLDQMFIDAAAI